MMVICILISAKQHLYHKPRKVVGMQETHMIGSLVACIEENECQMWEGMEGGVVWCR